MARMIPPVVDESIKSQAEKTVFKWLEAMDWRSAVVLHSLGISDHITNIFGEVDFVVISTGGILCIEVKGGEVFRENGRWHFKNRYGVENTKNTGPFMQAQGNMQSLRLYLKRRLKADDPIAQCQYACCVITPDCRIASEGSDIIPEILFDCNGKEEELGRFFDQCFSYWRNRLNEKHGFCGEDLSSADVNRAAELLRGDFHFVPSLTTVISRINGQLNMLTDEQYMLLEGLEENERLLVAGAAGTGKTLMAVEQCRRASAAGKRVLYICYNHLIASVVKEIRDHEEGTWEVSTLHALMQATIGDNTHIKHTSDYYSTTLPAKFLQSAEKGKVKADYDVIVIDEGQDLMTNRYISCASCLLKNGIENGRWSIFYDPQQDIFHRFSDPDSVFRRLADVSVSFRLTINCRNTRQIAFANQAISNFRQGRIMKAEGIPPGYVVYKDLKDETEKLFYRLRALRTQGLSVRNIVILSPYGNDNPRSCLYGMIPPSDLKGIRFNQSSRRADEDMYAAYTIQSFKGLEADVVIMVDTDRFNDNSRRLLNYVAVSRARSLLYVFYPETAEKERQDMLLKGMLMRR
jgi:Holliday junction resolvase-like predicted endonuclease